MHSQNSGNGPNSLSINGTKTVLLCESVESNRKLVSRLMDKHFPSFNLSVKDCVHDISDMSSKDIDIVILSVRLSEERKVHSLDVIRRNPALKNKPVIIITSSAKEKEEEVVKRLGVRDCIILPYESGRFKNAILKCIE